MLSTTYLALKIKTEQTKYKLSELSYGLSCLSHPQSQVVFLFYAYLSLHTGQKTLFPSDRI
jgi:hypothetical protein